MSDALHTPNDATLRLVRGDSAQLKITVTRPDDSGNPTPVDITGASLWFTVKRNPDDPDPGVLQKSMAGGITLLHPTDGVAVIDLDPADTELLPDTVAPSYDVQLKEASGRVTTVAVGKVEVVVDVTRSLV